MLQLTHSLCFSLETSNVQNGLNSRSITWQAETTNRIVVRINSKQSTQTACQHWHDVSVLTIDGASSMFARIVSPEAGGGVRWVRLEDDKEMVCGGEDVARHFCAAVRSNHRCFVVGAVVHRYRVVACRTRQLFFQLETLEAQQNVLPMTIHRPRSILSPSRQFKR